MATQNEIISPPFIGPLFSLVAMASCGIPFFNSGYNCEVQVNANDHITHSECFQPAEVLVLVNARAMLAL